MKTHIKIIFVVFAVFFSNHVMAATTITPLAVGIVPPVQFPSDDFTITGFRLSLLYGHHRNVYGLDVGALGNITDQTFTGLAVSGLFNKTGGQTTILGLQFAGVANINTNKVSAYGLQVALMNYQSADSDIVGLQLAAGNHAPFTDVFGVQAGLYNRAKEVYGLQLGVVNIAENLHGIQIGLINFNNKGLISVCPILNVGF
ncbi:hypothetical protein AZI86_02045 [Bdellovibrio bacteriovorus]|uniref:PhaC PHA synthase n=1 Tax=Bdellovibrio bacteriovorus TaxID=959 RepID=A0A150WNK1_BDEBC|nr:hypothetical protein [Bdellovibrio bacteriovorus]KYG65877.1 hypothetical protein AZI86_02045 [Bdellovibrio bacteriovorus]